MLNRRAFGILSLSALVMSGGWAYAQQGKAMTLTTQDYLDIQQLYAKYNMSIDTGDSEAWASTFTPDGVFMNNTGHDKLVEFVENWKKQGNPDKMRHWNTNMVITPTAEGAKGSVYLSLVNVSAKPPAPTATGMYFDTLVKTPQGWKFKTRTMKADPRPAPTQQQ